MKEKKLLLILSLLILPLIILILTNKLLPPNYIISSLYKLIFIFPLFYYIFIHKKSFKQSALENFSFTTFKKNFAKTITIGIILSSIYLLAYLIFSRFIDINSITDSLNQLASINAKNIILIGLYIILINSLLEEYFWRGFIYKETRKIFNPFLTHTLTGIAFSLHHIIFYYSWFTLPIITLVTIGLIGYSIIMNIIFQKYKDLYTCWLIHAFVDIIQIYIALRLFQII